MGTFDSSPIIIGVNAWHKEHEIITFKAGVKEVTKRPFVELLTMHLGRRTFIAQSLERGMTPSTMMKLSTHRDLKSFNLYINMTKTRNAWGRPSVEHTSCR